MRDKAVDAIFARAHRLPAAPSRETLEEIADALDALASQRKLWGAKAFADPPPNEQQARHLVREEEASGVTLYLNVMRPGKRIPPHNHTTWACIAAVEGAEHNTLFRPVDGVDGPGEAKLVVTGEVEVAPGRPIALLANDIHAVEIKGADMIRHLHLYGRALERLNDRLVFDLATNTAARMTMTVATRR